MNAKDPLVNALSSAFPAQDASPELRDRVNALKPRPTKSFNWTGLGVATCAAASVAAATFLLMPSTALAGEVLKHVDTVQGHMTMYWVNEDGNRLKVGSGWTSGAKLREDIQLDRGTIVNIEDPEKDLYVTWRSDSGKVSFRKKGMNVLAPEMVNPASLKDFVKNLVKAHGWSQSSQVDQVPLDGQNVDRVTLLGTGRLQGLEFKVYADPKTHHVLGWQTHFKPNASLGARDLLVLFDNQRVPANAFEAIFPVNGVKTDIAKDRATWQSRFVKPLATFDVPGGKVQVRSVICNSSGDLFVLYTGLHTDYGKNVIPMVVTDSTGGEYIKGSGFNPSDGGLGYHPFTYEGKPLDGSWFIRVKGGAPKGPVMVGFKKEFEPMTHLAFRYKLEPERISANVPPYMPYMSMPVSTSVQWKEERDMTLADYHERAKNYGEAERCLRDFVVLTTGPKREEGMLAGAWQYYKLSRLVEEQGRKGEAFKLMMKAQVTNATGPFRDKDLDERIQQSIDRLGKK